METAYCWPRNQPPMPVWHERHEQLPPEILINDSTGKRDQGAQARKVIWLTDSANKSTNWCVPDHLMQASTGVSN